MKNFRIVLAAILFLTMCNADYSVFYKYRIYNNSSHKIQLVVFHYCNPKLLAENPFIDTTFNLPIGDGVIYEDSYKTSRRVPDEAPANTVFGADSAHLIFDEAYIIRYNPTDGQPGNILRSDNYIGGKSGKRTFDYAYYISDKDYANAKKISK